MSSPCAGSATRTRRGQVNGLREMLPRVEHAHDVVLGFVVRRDAAVLGDGLRPGVVGGEDQASSALGRSAASGREDIARRPRDSRRDRAD